jgi:hypothetical protein
MNHGGT